jgi:hypothetical protein
MAISVIGQPTTEPARQASTAAAPIVHAVGAPIPRCWR